ncbi:protein phosphatase 1 regulatory inhibitor subunit 16B-like [Trichogramma pretiosum]|uniref:protein phosphatase 1 regulatory inhibitor subunit 16B-like n=1 Tax=Trichogramma pretiosum TaxID=7493 RepID=UPI0006C941FE|nr:protein phosphatase 1 regulatory inhibitor subunit 16B-like [Trichogramma pretiosum]
MSQSDPDGIREDVHDCGCDDPSASPSEKLQIMRAEVDWENEEERRRFFHRLYPLIENWDDDHLPDLRDIFRPEEIDWLLTEDLKKNRSEAEKKYSLIEFVIRSGYKDRPELNEDKKPILRRTTALHEASRLECSADLARSLFDIYRRYDANYVDEDGLTHFHVACGFDLVGKVAQFLVFGQNPNFPGSMIEPPLHVALRNRSEEMTEVLLRAGADPSLPDPRDGMTPLHAVCDSDFCCSDLAVILYEAGLERKRPIDVNARDRLGRTPLHYALKQECEKDVALLLRHGADPNCADDEGATPLHFLAKIGCDDDFMERFFEVCDDNNLKLQVNTRDNLGRTPLDWALRNLLARSVGVLLDRGADLTGLDFPTEDYFEHPYLQPEIGHGLFHKLPIKIASDAMAIVEQLEKKGYELNSSGAFIIIKTLADYEVFQDVPIVRSGPEYEKFAQEAREHMINADLSLYDLMQLRPEEAEQRLTHADYTRFVESDFEFPAASRRAYVLHLSETITRGFCRRWALRSFLEVTRYKYPIPWCEEWINSCNNKNLFFMNLLINFILLSETIPVLN